MIAAVSQSTVETAIVNLLLVVVIAAVVYGACALAKRPDVGRLGAAVVVVIGGLLVLLDVL